MQLVAEEPELSDGVVGLRRWTTLDLECVRAAGADPRIPRGTTVPRAWTTEAGQAFIARQHRRLTSGEGVSLAATFAHTDEAVGLVYLGRQPSPGTLSLGYCVIPGARRSRVGARAVRLAVEWALALPDVDRVVAWVEPDNPASMRLLAAAGFVSEGLRTAFLELDGKLADVVAFSRGAGPDAAPRTADAVDGPQ